MDSVTNDTPQQDLGPLGGDTIPPGVQHTTPKRVCEVPLYLCCVINRLYARKGHLIFCFQNTILQIVIMVTSEMITGCVYLFVLDLNSQTPH